MKKLAWATAFWTAAGTLFLALAWEAAARAIAAEIILPGPLVVAKRFVTLCTDPRFPSALFGSMTRVAGGFALSLPASVLFGMGAGLSASFRAFLRPFFVLVGATPVLSVILIAIIWFGQERVPLFTAFLIVFPVMSVNVTEGIRAADRRLIECARAYGLPPSALIRHLYLPGLMPFLLAGTRASFALAWKVVVAAEVLAQPLRALGTEMQRAKAQLETTDLFAWTAATVLAAAATDAALSVFVKGRTPHGDRL